MKGSNPLVRQGRTVYTGTSRTDGKGSKCCFKVILGLILVGLPSVLFYVERYQRQLELAFEELESQIVEVDADEMTTFPQKDGTPVYLSSEYTGSASDPAFGLDVDHALTLTRDTEYCQWLETSQESCDTCTDNDGNSYKCHCSTTYYYHLGWRKHLIMSALFDQPFNHNNPQRNPYPTAQIASANTIAEIGRASCRERV